MISLQKIAKMRPRVAIIGASLELRSLQCMALSNLHLYKRSFVLQVPSHPEVCFLQDATVHLLFQYSEQIMKQMAQLVNWHRSGSREAVMWDLSGRSGARLVLEVNEAGLSVSCFLGSSVVLCPWALNL